MFIIAMLSLVFATMPVLGAAQARRCARIRRASRPRRSRRRPRQPAPGNPVAVISTSMGDITVELFKDKAPVSVQNFLQYVNEGFYSGTIFHRVKPRFVDPGRRLQPPRWWSEGTRPPILNEATNGLKNTRGTLAMARTRALRSATSQFYINVVNNTDFDHVELRAERIRLRGVRAGPLGDGSRGPDRHHPDRLEGWTRGCPATPVVIKKHHGQMNQLQTPNSKLQKLTSVIS